MAGIENKSDFQKKLLNRFLKYTKIIIFLVNIIKMTKKYIEEYNEREE